MIRAGDRAVALAGGARIHLGRRFWLTVDALVGCVPVALEPHAEGRSVGGIARLLLGTDVRIAVGL